MDSLLDNAPKYVDKDFIRQRYNCGVSKAYEIIRTIKHEMNGGGLPYRGRVKMIELLEWEKLFERKYKERL